MRGFFFYSGVTYTFVTYFFKLRSVLFAAHVSYDIHVASSKGGEWMNPKYRTAAYVTRKHFRRAIANIRRRILPTDIPENIPRYTTYKYAFPGSIPAA